MSWVLTPEDRVRLTEAVSDMVMFATSYKMTSKPVDLVNYDLARTKFKDVLDNLPKAE